MKHLALCALLAGLASCAPAEPLLLSQTPASVEFCFDADGGQSVADRAQAMCAANGRDAALQPRDHCIAGGSRLTRYTFYCVPRG